MSTNAFKYVNPWVRGLLYAAIVLLVIIVIFPFAWLLILSFKSTNDIFAGAAKLISTPTFSNYASPLGRRLSPLVHE